MSIRKYFFCLLLTGFISCRNNARNAEVLQTLEIRVDSFQSYVKEKYGDRAPTYMNNNIFEMNVKNNISTEFWQQGNSGAGPEEFGNFEKDGYSLKSIPGAANAELIFKAKIDSGFIKVPVGLLYKVKQ